MLINFTVENWRSFRDKAELNLVASSREKRHTTRLLQPEGVGGLNLLPTAAIYGGNASGKSNLVKALAFARQLITFGTSSHEIIGVDTFRLDDQFCQKPARFGFAFLVPAVDNNGDATTDFECYEYSFSVTSTKICEEKLVQIVGETEELLFFRKAVAGSGYDVKYAPYIEKDGILHAVLESTRQNQLFLRNCADQNMDKYRTKSLARIYHWFENLFVIYPDTSYSPEGLWLILKNYDLKTHFFSTLSNLDTGISRLEFEYVTNTPVVESLKSELVRHNGTKIVAVHKSGNRYYVTRDGNSIECYRVISYHKDSRQHADVPFEFKDDSDGTIRIVDLLPFFLNASHNSGHVFVIDELDRSLHTLLVRRLLELYLDSCRADFRSQIIFTTHDVLQMDQELFRRDEMWLTERKNDGSTELIPMSSFHEIQDDESIRTSYLRGQLGGIPRFLLIDRLDNPIMK